MDHGRKHGESFHEMPHPQLYYGNGKEGRVTPSQLPFPSVLKMDAWALYVISLQYIIYLI